MLPVSLPLSGCLSPAPRLRMRAALPYFRVVCRCADSVGTPRRVSPAGKKSSVPLSKTLPASRSCLRGPQAPLGGTLLTAEAAFRSLRPVERSADHRRVRAVFVVPDGHFCSDLHNKEPGRSPRRLFVRGARYFSDGYTH